MALGNGSGRQQRKRQRVKEKFWKVMRFHRLFFDIIFSPG
jgi:hypothetical protein